MPGSDRIKSSITKNSLGIPQLPEKYPKSGKMTGKIFLTFLAAKEKKICNVGKCHEKNLNTKKKVLEVQNCQKKSPKSGKITGRNS